MNKIRYSSILIAIIALFVLWPGVAQAQEPTGVRTGYCVVDFRDLNGDLEIRRYDTNNMNNLLNTYPLSLFYSDSGTTLSTSGMYGVFGVTNAISATYGFPRIDDARVGYLVKTSGTKGEDYYHKTWTSCGNYTRSDYGVSTTPVWVWSPASPPAGHDYSFYWALIMAKDSTNKIYSAVLEMPCEYYVPPATATPCDTVANADFQAEAGWSLTGSAAISESILSLSVGDYATQNITTTETITANTQYTVWLTGSNAITTSTGELLISLAGVTTTLTISDSGAYTATLNVPQSQNNNLSMGSLSGDLLIDYICFSAGGTAYTCFDGPVTDFDLNTGNNAGYLGSDEFDDGWFFDGGSYYGVSQGWQWTPYGFLNSSYTGNEYLVRFDPVMIDATFNLFPVTEKGLFAYGTPVDSINPLMRYDDGDRIAIEYDPMLMPEMITATVIYPSEMDAVVEVWLNDSEWSLVGEIAADGDEVGSGRYSSAVVNFDFQHQYSNTPVNLALAIRSVNDTGYSIAVEPSLGFNSIELKGCHAGDALYESDCVVSDPDLNESDGWPSEFYWLGDYLRSDEGATINSGQVIYQSVTPTEAETYQVDLAISNYTSAGNSCEFVFSVDAFAGLDQFDSESIDCTDAGGLVQTYTLWIDMPAQPVEVRLSQTTGSIYLDYMCIHSPDSPTCLNSNPLLVNGETGYTGDFTTNSGAFTLSPGNSMTAVDIPYTLSAEQNYIVVVTGHPDAGSVNTIITDEQSPPAAYDVGTAISNTVTLTHAFEAATTMVAAGDGPTLWNWNVSGGNDLIVDSYCVQESTGPIWYGNDCPTLSNADFLDGLSAWDTDNVSSVGGWAVLGSGGSVQQSYTFNPAQNVTLHWIAKSSPGESMTGTVNISSESGSYTLSHPFSDSMSGTEYFDNSIAVSGTVTISATGEAGLSLDYICLLPGEYTGGGDGPGTTPPEELADQCPSPPMETVGVDDWIGLIIPAWAADLWPGVDPPTAQESVELYIAAWQRYTGCMVYSLYQMTLYKFNEVIRWLQVIAGLSFVDALASLVSAIADLGQLVEESIDDVIDAIAGPGATLAYLVGILVLIISALVGLILLIIGIIALIWSVPIEFWQSFNDALNSNLAIALPLPDSEDHPLLFMLYAFRLFNETIGETIIFPLTVAALIIGSVYVFLWTIKRFKVKL